ncbi:MAG: hypothetical protein EXS16_17050 [Gemmataceae bacterium]|nr:hypothetical protein [Gemmataceae bacterium]
MRFKPWGTWGALGLLCALMIGCNNTNRQPEKTLGATSGNPPQGKLSTSTGAPAYGVNGKPFPTTGGIPNGTGFNNSQGTSTSGGLPNLTPPALGGFQQPNAGGFTPNANGFVPPNTGNPAYSNPPNLAPTPNIAQPTPGFNSDRNTVSPDSTFSGVKMLGQP